MSKKILIIDDDRTNITLIKSRLESKGYVVFSALDGEEGLAQVSANKPDLILLDVEMPKMDGYTFINELRKIDPQKTIPVIVLTAHSEHQPIFSLKGVKGYLVKPVNFDLLIPKIVQYLGT